MTRHLLTVVGLLALAVATLAGLAVAHGNHATAHAQVSANGTVVVEQVFLTEPGYLVVRADDDGTPGRVLGHRSLGGGLHTGATVRIDDPAWRNVTGNTTVWTVLHADDGDGSFDPGEDDLYSWFGRPAGERIELGKRDGAASVVTGSGRSETTGELSVERVALPADGYVVVRERSNDSLGRAHGSRALSAGTHVDVRVPVNLRGNRSTWPLLSIAVHTDDGDGTFDADDPVVRVAGTPVASPVGTSGTATQPPTVAVNTPTDDGAREVSDRTLTATPATPTTSGDGTGFGVGVVLVAAVVALLVAPRVRV